MDLTKQPADTCEASAVTQRALLQASAHQCVTVLRSTSEAFITVAVTSVSCHALLALALLQYA